MNRENDELHLRSLPRERASDFFTTRVMARVRESELKPGRPSVAIFATSIAGVILLALAVGFAVDGPPALSETTMLAATNDENRSAVESIEAGETQFEPVIYVGSTDHYDFYLDLTPSETTAAGIHTASYHGELQPGL